MSSIYVRRSITKPMLSSSKLTDANIYAPDIIVGKASRIS